jgi:hypothetical protein
MSYRLLHRVFFKHAKLILWNQNNRKIHTVKELVRPQPNIQTVRKDIHDQVVEMHFYYLQPLQVNLANEVKNNNSLISRYSRRLFISNVLNRVTNPVSAALRAEATKK